MTQNLIANTSIISNENLIKDQDEKDEQEKFE